MPVLTNFLKEQKLDTKNVSKKDLTELNNFYNSVASQKGDKTIILEQEKKLLKDFWIKYGFIPDDIFYRIRDLRLSDLLEYPVVQVSELKKLADALSFVILPIDYVDMEKIINMYAKQNESYASIIKYCYDRFKGQVAYFSKYMGEQLLYMLVPFSFYEPWKEVFSEEFSSIPKYFSEKLFDLSTTWDMIIPILRFLYEDIKNTKGVEEYQERIYKLERYVNASKAKKAKKKLKKELYLEKHKPSCGEGLLEPEDFYHPSVQYLNPYPRQCIDDPIIFAIDSCTDISDSSHDEHYARIGLCFGLNMPIDFFTENGLTAINDRSFEEVTEILEI